jgi:CheY-like chemotaxis protein
MRIVLIEDDPDVQGLMVTLLQRKGHTVYAESESVDGIQTVLREQPDIVLTDIRMAQQYNGIGIAAMLKRDPRTDHIPVVAVTGYATDDDTARYQEMGFAGVIPKPFEVGEFVKRVEGFVK